MPTFAERVARLAAISNQQVQPVDPNTLPQEYSTLTVPQGTLRDADTLDRTSGEANRSYGINAPELRDKQTHELLRPGQEAYARAAEVYAANPDSRPVRYGEDKHGRTVADEVTPDGRSLNGEMVRRGIAAPANYNKAPQLPFAAEARQRFRDTYTPDSREQDIAYSQGIDHVNAVPEPVAFDPKYRTIGETLSSSVERGFEGAKAGYHGTVSAVGNLLSRDLPGGKDPRSVPDDDPRLTLRDRFTNWLQRTGEAGYMEHTAKAAAIPKGATLQDAMERGTFGGYATFALEAMGEAIPSIVEMVGTGLATGGVGAVGRLAINKVLQRQAVNAMRKRLMVTGTAPLIAQQQAKSIVANLPEHLARSAKVGEAFRKGRIAGMFGSSAGMQAGQFYEETKNETGVVAPGAALLAGGLAGALDVAGFEVLLHHFLDKKIPIKTAMDILKPVLAAGALGTTGEGVTEAAQEVIGTLNKEYHRPSDVPLIDRMLSKENLWRYAEAGAAGAIFGGAFGGMGGAAKGTYGYATREKPVTEPTAADETKPAITETPAAEQVTETPAAATAESEIVPPLGEVDPATGQPTGTPPIVESDQEAGIPPVVESDVEPNGIPPVPNADVEPNGIPPVPNADVEPNGIPPVPNAEADPTVVPPVPDIDPATGQPTGIPPVPESTPESTPPLVDPTADPSAIPPVVEPTADPSTIPPVPESTPESIPPVVEPTAEPDAIPPVVEPTAEPDAIPPVPESNKGQQTPTVAADPAPTEPTPKWQEPTTDLAALNGYVFDSTDEAQTVANTLRSAGLRNLSTRTDENNRTAITHKLNALGIAENEDSETIRQPVLVAVQKAVDFVGDATRLGRLMSRNLSPNGQIVSSKGVVEAVPKLLVADGESNFASLNEAYKVATETYGLKPGEFAFKQLENGNYQVADIRKFPKPEEKVGSPPKMAAKPKAKPVAKPVAATPVATASAGQTLAKAIKDSAKNLPTIKADLRRKDAAKAEQATQFIGQGDIGTSTHFYAGEATKLGIANTGKYTANDVVFVSVNGKSSDPVFTPDGNKLQGKFAPVYGNLDKAIAAGATIITDVAGTSFGQRNSEHNLNGEGRLARYLEKHGYQETSPGNGKWQRSAAPKNDAASSIVKGRLINGFANDTPMGKIVLTMRDDVQKLLRSVLGETTKLFAYHAIIAGLRTATSRNPSTKGQEFVASLQVGDVIEIPFPGHSSIKVRVIEPVRPVKDVAPETWSIGEGWTKDGYNAVNDGRYLWVQFAYDPALNSEANNKIHANFQKLRGMQTRAAPVSAAPKNDAASYDNEVFVFGSNLQGIHGKGAALDAKTSFGAQQGVGEGATGQSYALPTKATPAKSLPLSVVAQHVYKFIAHALKHPRTKFRLTKVGTGLAGHPEAEIAKLFAQAPANVVLVDKDGKDIGPASEWHKPKAAPVSASPKNDAASSAPTPESAQGKPASPGAVGGVTAVQGTTIDSANRRRDAERIAKEHPDLTEKGQEYFLIRDNNGNVLATGYTRVVYGDHGPYIELDEDQIVWANFPRHNKKHEKAWYDEHRTEDGKVMLYAQKRDVKGLPNPPKGKYSVNNNRAEGYADYKPGKYYLSPDDVITGEGPKTEEVQWINESELITYLEETLGKGAGVALNSRFASAAFIKILANEVSLQAKLVNNEWVFTPLAPASTSAPASPGIQTPFDSKRSGSGHTVESFTQELRKVLGKTLANKLLSRPNVTVLANTTDAPFKVSPDTAGLYLPDGRVFFFASNIGPGEAFGKLIHELGAHYGLQRMVGKETYDAIISQLQTMVKADGFESVKAAHARAVKALGDANHPKIWDETLAYLAEASPRHGLIRRLITAIKRFLLSLGYPAGRLSEADMVGLIQVAAFKEGRYEGLAGEQLASKRDLNGQLVDLLGDLSISIERSQGADAAVDFVNRVGRIADSAEGERLIPIIASRFITFIAHPLKSFQEGLWKLVDSTPEMQALDKPASIDKLDVLSKYLADVFTGVTTATGQFKTELEKFAKDVLAQGTAALIPDTAFEDRSPVDLPKLLEKFPEHAAVIRKFSDAGFVLTGSASLGTQGTVLRPDANPFHDLDFTAPLSLFGESEEKHTEALLEILGYKKSQYALTNVIKPKGKVADIAGIDTDRIDHTTYSYRVPISSRYAFLTQERKQIVSTESGEAVFTEGKGHEVVKVIDQETGKEVPLDGHYIDIDFFPYRGDSPTRNVAGVNTVAWNDIFAAKISFIRQGEGLRDKDAVDYALFTPLVGADTAAMKAERRFDGNEAYQSVPVFQHYGLTGFEKSPKLRGKLNEAINLLKKQGVPDFLLDNIVKFAISTKNSQPGMLWENKLILALDKQLLENGSIQAIAEVVAHEVAHDADFQLQRGIAQTHQSELFDISIDEKGRAKLGVVLEELHKVYVQNKENFASILVYPFSEYNRAVTTNNEAILDGIKSEAFAQASMLYWMQPQALKRAAPKTFALMEGIYATRDDFVPRRNFLYARRTGLYKRVRDALQTRSATGGMQRPGLKRQAPGRAGSQRADQGVRGVAAPDAGGLLRRRELVGEPQFSKDPALKLESFTREDATGKVEQRWGVFYNGTLVGDYRNEVLAKRRYAALQPGEEQAPAEVRGPAKPKDPDYIVDPKTGATRTVGTPEGKPLALPEARVAKPDDGKTYPAQTRATPSASRVTPSSSLRLLLTQNGRLGKLGSLLRKYSPERQLGAMSLALRRYPNMAKVVSQAIQIVNAGWPQDRVVRALDALYLKNKATMDSFRALTSFVGDDLPLAEHFAKVVEFQEQHQPTRESSVLEDIGESSDVFKALLKLGIDVDPNSPGFNEEDPELHTDVLFEGKYFTDMLKYEIQPLLDAHKMSENAAMEAFDRVEEVRNGRLTDIHFGGDLTLEDHLMALRRQAALSPNRRASFYLGDAEIFATRGGLAGLTAQGKQLFAYIKKKTDQAAKLWEQNPSLADKKDKGTGNINRFLLMIENLQAMHDAMNRPWGELQVVYNADTQQYTIEEVFFSPVNHAGASFATIPNRKTGELISLRDYVDRYLKSIANNWKKPTDKEAQAKWAKNVISLIKIEDVLTPKQIVDYEARMVELGDKYKQLMGETPEERPAKNPAAERFRKRNEVVAKQLASRIYLRGKHLTRLGWSLGVAHGRYFTNDYEAFQYAQQVLLEEVGLVVENYHDSLNWVNISGAKDENIELFYGEAQKKFAEIRAKRLAGVDEDAELEDRPEYGPGWNPTSDTLRKVQAVLTSEFARWRGEKLASRDALYKALNTLKPELSVEDFRAVNGIMRKELSDQINALYDPDTGSTSDTAVAEAMAEFFDTFYEDRLDKLATRKAYQDGQDLQHYDRDKGTSTGIEERQVDRDQDQANKDRQARVVKYDILGETSAKVTGEENLPPPPGGVSEAGNPKKSSAAHKLVSAVVEALGLTGLNIKLFSSKDLEAYEEALRTKSLMTWIDFANKKESGLPPASVAFIDGQVLIYYDADLNKKPAQLAEALSHELGHVVFRSLLDQERQRNTELWQQIQSDYLASGSEQRFMEWFADETAKWAREQILTSRDENAFMSKVAKAVSSASGRVSFMARIVQAIKTLMESLGFTPDKGAVSAYLDGLARREEAKGVALTLDDLGGHTTNADMLTYQMSAMSRTAPLLRHGVSRVDFLTLDGVKRGTMAQYQKALNALPILAKTDHIVRGTYRFVEDALSSMNAWLREQGLPELNLLADKLDNQARAARTVKLLSNNEIEELLYNDPRFKDLAEKNKTTGANSRFVTELLARADAIRKMDGVDGVQIVTWVHSGTGERRAEAVPVHRASFNEAVRRLYDGQWGAGPEGYRRLIHNKSEAESRQWGEELLRNAPKSEGAKAIKAWLDKFYNEYVVPGYTGPHSRAEGTPTVHIGRLEDWGLARYYNKDAVERNYEQFVEMLTKDYKNADGSVRWKGMQFQEARALAAGIITGREAVLKDQNKEELLINPTFSPGAESKKTREIDIPIDELLPFLETRVDKILDSYAHSMIKRVEWDRRFGEEIRKEDNEGNVRWIWQQNYHLDNIKQGVMFNNPAVKTQRLKYVLDKTGKVTEAYLGRYGAFDTDPRARQLISWTQVGTNYLVMPLSLLSQFPDFVGPLTRMGGNHKAYFRGFREAAREIFRQDGDVWRVAEMMGIIYRDTKNLGASALFDQQYMTEGAQKANDFLFKINGMQLFTNFSRLVSFQTSKYWLQDLVAHKDGDRLLDQVGLTKQDVIDWVKDGYKNYESSDGEDSVPYKVMLARIRFVNESVFSPHAGQRPLIANHPYMALVWHLKQFTYSFYTQLLKPALREVRDNPAMYGKMMAVLPLALMFPLAMLGMGLRDELKQGLGRDGERLSFDKDSDGWFSEFGKVLSRTGVLGPIQLLLDADRSSSWGRSFTFSLAGPSASKLEEVFLADGKLDAAMRMIPGLAMMPAERQAVRQWWNEE